MKIGRFIAAGDDTPFYGIVSGDRVVRISGLDDKKELGSYDPGKLSVLTPVLPTKIVAVGLNYRYHASELNFKLPDEPLIFLKPASSILPHGEGIVYPDMTNRLDYEAELGIVIGKKVKNINIKEAEEYILGYTAFNDVTARDIQSKDGQWTRAKGFDTFSPFGPYVQTDLENPQSLKIQAVLNGEIRQNSNTSDMIFPIPYLVSYISRVMTLYPGDVIATGTPEGIGPMNRGDEIRIRIEGLDDLVNTVI